METWIVGGLAVAIFALALARSRRRTSRRGGDDGGGPVWVDGGSPRRGHNEGDPDSGSDGGDGGGGGGD
jgi:uncharacterized membrane protein